MTSFSCLDAEKFLSPRPEQPLNCVFSYLSAEQRAAGFGEADVSAAFVQDQPAMGDRIIKAGLVLSRCALFSNRNGPLIFSTRMWPSCGRR
jgi:hypothetical protein